MRTESKLTVFTLTDGSTIITRSALETRWAIFFNELRLSWQYEPHRISGYLPDFKVEGLGYVEIKPTLDLLIIESAPNILRASSQIPEEKIYVFIGEKVSLQTIAIYHDRQIFTPTFSQMVAILNALTGLNGPISAMFISTCINRANRAKLDHFLSVGKVLELETIPSQRKIVREASEKLRSELNR